MPAKAGIQFLAPGSPLSAFAKASADSDLNPSKPLGVDGSRGEAAADLSAPVPPTLLGDVLDRHDALVVGGVEYDHALRRTADDANALDPRADQLPGVRHQHDLVAFLDRERGHQLAGLVADRLCALLAFEDAHRDDAFAAAIGDAVLVGRRALPHALLGDGQHELFGSRHLDVTLFAELDRAGCLLGIRLFLGIDLILFGPAPHRVGAFEVSGAFVRRRLDVAQDRHRDDPVAGIERDAPHAHRRAPGKHAHTVL